VYDEDYDKTVFFLLPLSLFIEIFKAVILREDFPEGFSESQVTFYVFVLLDTFVNFMRRLPFDCRRFPTIITLFI